MRKNVPIPRLSPAVPFSARWKCQLHECVDCSRCCRDVCRSFPTLTHTYL